MLLAIDKCNGNDAQSSLDALSYRMAVKSQSVALVRVFTRYSHYQAEITRTMFDEIVDIIEQEGLISL